MAIEDRSKPMTDLCPEVRPFMGPLCSIPARQYFSLHHTTGGSEKPHLGHGCSVGNLRRIRKRRDKAEGISIGGNAWQNCSLARLYGYVWVTGPKLNVSLHDAPIWLY